MNLSEGLSFREDGTLVISDGELAQEFAKRVVGGLIKAVRAYVPTRTNLEGKKEYCYVAVHNGSVVVGTDHAHFIGIITADIVEMCKKKSPLREALTCLNYGYSACINYGVTSPWMKLHEKNIRYAEIGPNGIILAVAPGIVELRMDATDESTEYALGVLNTIEQRAGSEIQPLVSAELPWSLVEAAKNATVLRISNDSVASIHEQVDLAADCAIQMKFRFKMLPGKDCMVHIYQDEEARIARFITESAPLSVDQLFRVLPFA